MARKPKIGPNGKWVSEKHPRVAVFLNKQADIGKWMIKSRFAYVFYAVIFTITALIVFFFT